MTTWKYNGTEISFDSARATFSATVGRKTLSGPSLDAVKKKIDAESRFEPWPCYLERQGWGVAKGGPGVTLFLKGPHRGERALCEGVVIGIEKPRGRSDRPEWRVQFLDSNGKKLERTERVVLPRTPEALAAWKKHWETAERQAAAEKQLEEKNAAELAPLREAMPYRRAGEG